MTFGRFSGINTNTLRLLLVILSLIGVVWLLKFSPFCVSEPAQAGVLALLILVFWATALIPEHLTALLFFLLAMIFYM